MTFEDLIKKLQREMNSHGEALVIDGDPGPRTKGSLTKFDVDLKLTKTFVEPLPKPPTLPIPLPGESKYLYPGRHRFVSDPDLGGYMSKINGCVIHHTASYNVNSTIETFKRNIVDIHFIVGHDGEVVQMAEVNRVAAHAGASDWNGFTNLNSSFVGIEVVNIGYLYKIGDQFLDYVNYDRYKNGQSYNPWKGPVRHRPGLGHEYWEPFTSQQEQAIFSILKWLHDVHGVKAENVCGHYECSHSGKVDPYGGFNIGAMPAYREWLTSFLIQT